MEIDNKQTVLAKYPFARARKCGLCGDGPSDYWHIWDGWTDQLTFERLGNGDTEDEAWADAASRLEAEGRCTE